MSQDDLIMQGSSGDTEEQDSVGIFQDDGAAGEGQPLSVDPEMGPRVSRQEVDSEVSFGMGDSALPEPHDNDLAGSRSSHIRKGIIITNTERDDLEAEINKLRMEAEIRDLPLSLLLFRIVMRTCLTQDQTQRMLENGKLGLPTIFNGDVCIENDSRHHYR